MSHNDFMSESELAQWKDMYLTKLKSIGVNVTTNQEKQDHDYNGWKYGYYSNPVMKVAATGQVAKAAVAQGSSHVVADGPSWEDVAEPEMPYTAMPHLYTWACNPEFGTPGDQIMVMAESMQDAIIRARDYHKKKYPNSAPEKVKWRAQRTDIMPEEQF